MKKEETLYLKLIYVNIYYMSNININNELLKTKFLFQRLKEIIQSNNIKSSDGDFFNIIWNSVKEQHSILKDEYGDTRDNPVNEKLSQNYESMKLFLQSLKELRDNLNNNLDDKNEKQLKVIQDLNNYVDDAENRVKYEERKGGMMGKMGRASKNVSSKLSSLGSKMKNIIPKRKRNESKESEESEQPSAEEPEQTSAEEPEQPSSEEPESKVESAKSPKITDDEELLKIIESDENILVVNDGENGNNACWINAPLYAILSHKEIMDVNNFIEDPSLENSSIKNYQDIYDKLQLLRFTGSRGGWNNESYKDLYDSMKEHTEDNTINYGEYGNAYDALVLFKDVILKGQSGQELKIETINSGKIDDLINFHKNEYELLSFVTGVNCIKSLDNIGDAVNDEQNYGHYISFAKVNDDNWIKVDMLKTPNSKIIKKEDIPDLLPCKEGEMRQYFGVFKKRFNVNEIENELENNQDEAIVAGPGVETVISEINDVAKSTSPTDIQLELSDDDIKQPNGVQSDIDTIDLRPPTPPLVDEEEIKLNQTRPPTPPLPEENIPLPPLSPSKKEPKRLSSKKLPALNNNNNKQETSSQNESKNDKDDNKDKDENPAKKELDKKLVTFQKSLNDLINTSVRLKNIEFTTISENKKDIIKQLRKNHPSKEVIFKYIDDITNKELKLVDIDDDTNRLDNFLSKLKELEIISRIRMVYGIQVKDNNDIIYYFNEILKILKQIKTKKGEKRVRGTIGRNIKEVVKGNNDFKGEDKGPGMKLIVRAVISEMNEINKLFTLYQVFAQQLRGIKDILSNMKGEEVSEIDEALSFINKTVTDADVGGRRKTQRLRLKLKKKKHSKKTRKNRKKKSKKRRKKG